MNSLNPTICWDDKWEALSWGAGVWAVLTQPLKPIIYNELYGPAQAVL